MKKIGLIVNPRAGLGGRVGLKGSDGPTIQKKALELGAVGESQKKAKKALMVIQEAIEVNIITYPHEMGEDLAKKLGLPTTVIGSIEKGCTTPRETKEAAIQLKKRDIHLLLFAGGDGTARDIHDALGNDGPVLGIPAGVKIHSGVYSTSPTKAGELALSFLKGETTTLRESEVMDINEEAFRDGRLSAALYGYMKVPYKERMVQDLKAGSIPGDSKAVEAITYQVVEEMEEDVVYIIGPGTTTRAVMERLGLPSTLLGVDVVLNKELLGQDLNEKGILEIIKDRPAKILVTVIGGQGYIFGRGNQPISPTVISKVGRHHIMVIATQRKLSSLDNRILLVDTGDERVDALLSGFQRVLVDYGQEVILPVKS